MVVVVRPAIVGLQVGFLLRPRLMLPVGKTFSPGETSDFQFLERIKVTKQEALQFVADRYGYTEPDPCPPPHNQQFSAEKHRILPSLLMPP